MYLTSYRSLTYSIGIISNGLCCVVPMRQRRGGRVASIVAATYRGLDYRQLQCLHAKGCKSHDHFINGWESDDKRLIAYSTIVALYLAHGRTNRVCFDISVAEILAVLCAFTASTDGFFNIQIVLRLNLISPVAL